MDGEPRSSSAESSSRTTESVETLIEVGLQDYLTEADEILFQRDCVMELWNAAREETGDLQELAIWGLGEVARDRRRDGIGSLALDRLDRIAKEEPRGAVRQHASRALRHALQT